VNFVPIPFDYAFRQIDGSKNHVVCLAEFIREIFRMTFDIIWFQKTWKWSSWFIRYRI